MKDKDGENGSTLKRLNRHDSQMECMTLVESWARFLFYQGHRVEVKFFRLDTVFIKVNFLILRIILCENDFVLIKYTLNFLDIKGYLLLSLR